MAEPKKKEKPTKIKKRKWYPIIAPKMFRNALLGETLIEEPKLALNKTVTQNLMNLTHDVKRQNINIKFIVDKIEGSNAHTSIIGYSMIPASIKRLTRRRSEKIELSFTCLTSDNKMVRIKPLIFARSLAKGSVYKKIVHETVDNLTKAINKITFDNLINDLITHKLQSSMAERLRKISPLRRFEIKSAEITKEKKPLEAKAVKVEVKKEEKKEEAEEEKVEEKKEEAKEEEKEAEVKEEKPKEKPKKEVKEEK
jgi:small subunit ribosomal protein S3Ae